MGAEGRAPVRVPGRQSGPEPAGNEVSPKMAPQAEAGNKFAQTWPENVRPKHPHKDEVGSRPTYVLSGVLLGWGTAEHGSIDHGK